MADLLTITHDEFLSVIRGRIVDAGTAQLWAGNVAGVAQTAEVVFD